MAEPTRLELAASCVTGRRSNRLNYGSAKLVGILIKSQIEGFWQEKNVEKKDFL